MRDKKRIMVIPAFKGAGASFTASCLAFALAERAKEQKSGAAVSLAEPCASTYFIEGGFEKEYLDGSFESYTAVLETGGKLADIRNSRGGVNCLIRVPETDAKLSNSRLFRFLTSAPGDIVICDCSNMDEENVFEAASDADACVFVIDPLPVRLVENSERIGRFLLRFPSACIVADKMNQGIHKAQFTRFLSGKKYLPLSFLEPALIYRAQYAKVFPYELMQVKEALRGELDMILDELEKTAGL